MLPLVDILFGLEVLEVSGANDTCYISMAGVRSDDFELIDTHFDACLDYRGSPWGLRAPKRLFMID